MKCFIILVALFITFNIACAGQAEMFKKLATKCKKQEKASDEDVEKASKGLAPDTKEGKCLAACMSEQFGFVSNNLILFYSNYFYLNK